MNKSKLPLIQDEILVNKIHFIRGQKVMIDRDLAELYGVETKRLKEAVKRNIQRFPSDFMFELSVKEFENWRTQFATSNSDKMGLRYLPFAFTEQGVIMLSSVLTTDQAVQTNIRVVRIFIRLREIASANKEILLKLEKLENQMSNKENKTMKQEKEIQLIFVYLKKLFNTNIPLPPPKRVVGFKTKAHE